MKWILFRVCFRWASKINWHNTLILSVQQNKYSSLLTIVLFLSRLAVCVCVCCCFSMISSLACFLAFLPVPYFFSLLCFSSLQADSLYTFPSPIRITTARIHIQFHILNVWARTHTARALLPCVMYMMYAVRFLQCVQFLLLLSFLSLDKNVLWTVCFVGIVIFFRQVFLLQ